MTKTEKAARIVHGDNIQVTTDKVYVLEGGQPVYEFSLEDAETILETVIALGEKHDIEIYYNGSDWENTHSINDGEHDTYQAAVEAAVEDIEL